MNAPLDEQYLSWLYSQAGSVKLKTSSRTWWQLFRQLYTKEFIWLIPNDDNRVADGRELRYEFLDSEEIDDVDPNWLGLGCSMLEMLLGLARRLSFEAGGEVRVWFWHLLENLDLVCCDKDYTPQEATRIDEVLDKVIWRRYAPDGKGGLFPLKKTNLDQRRVEIWYQMSAYLMELG